MEQQQEQVKESGYDQKAFLQLRLHELLQQTDKLSSCPLYKNQEYDSYNYQIIFNNLCSIFQTIYSKLKIEEREKGLIIRDSLKIIITKRVIQIVIRDNQVGTRVDNDWIIINDGLFVFRCLLEKFMDAHGFNPSKDDVGKSIIKL